MKLDIKTPRWAVPLLAKSRLKGAKGGRSCVHEDTPIDTPTGQVRIKDFHGGKILAMAKGRVVECVANAAVEFQEEELFEVVFADGRSIRATAKHRFLTPSGWKMLSSLGISSNIVCVIPSFSRTLPLSSSGIFRREFLQGGLRCSERLSGFLGRCSLYLRRCGQQPLLAVGSDLDSPPSQACVSQHSFRASSRSGDHGQFGIRILSSSFSLLSTMLSPRAWGARNCEGQGNCSGGKSSGQPSQKHQAQKLSRARTCHRQPSMPPKQHSAASSLQSCLERILKTISGTRPYAYLYNFLAWVSPSGRDSRIAEIALIRSIGRHKYWDIHVPIFNNYLSDGVVNHNSGKSHFFAERLVEHHIADPNLASVCVREVQKSLKYSAKRLIEGKIESLGVGHLFDVTSTEIRRVDGRGIIIFQGMQDHTAESIKSLEGFGIAWCEESQSLSQRSIDLLIPTIREPGSEIWFSWNPGQETDPVERLLVSHPHDDAIVVHVNYTDNPFCPQVSIDEAESWLKRDPETYGHVWLGDYATRADDQVLSGCWRVDEFDIDPSWDGPYFGADWGFSTDPNALVKCYIGGNTLYLAREAVGYGIEIDDTPEFFRRIDESETHVVRCDSARPEIIRYMQRHGFPRVTAADKWPGSVEDGISKLRSFDEIVIDRSCKHAIDEARFWRYKRDRLTGDVLPKLEEGNDHCMDSIRYSISPLIKRPAQAAAW